MIRFFFNQFASILVSLVLVFSQGFLVSSAFAQGFNQDISLSPDTVRVPANILQGGRIRMYVTVRNNSQFDLSGVVKFYNERTSSFLSADQPVSILAGKTDDVFVDWTAGAVGTHPISIRVVPWDEAGDDPSNNKITKNVIVDTDSDGDGYGDRNDSDDDNDGVKDKDDAFPKDPNESKDTDGDGIGDNADTDDDNDGVSDIEDAFPTNGNESKDSDADGTGDNGDLFPFNAGESTDSDGDGVGDNEDPNDNNHGPKPFITMSETSVRTGELLTLSGISSTDPDGEIVDYSWDFGDGQVGEGVMVDHTYASAGEYIVALTVKDSGGESRTQEVQITVGMNIWLIVLIVFSILLLILLLALLIPGSRFHHKKMRMDFQPPENL